MSELLFFDVDGTLITLDDRHEMPESTKEALYQAKENGHKIFINTGRVKTAIDRHLLEFGFDGLVCGCGTYIEYEGQTLFHNRLSKEQCLHYAKILRDNHFQTVFEGKDRLFIEGDYGKGGFMEYIYEYFSRNSDYPIESSSHPEFIFDKFTTVRMPDSEVRVLEQEFGKDFTVIPHSEQVYELVPKGFSKATGIQYMMEYLGASLSDCYAFGDSINDLEMLKYVPHSVAMGNSVEAVFDVAEYKTRHIKENGIREALLHYELIR